MVVTLQSFLIQFSRFLSEYHKKHIKTTFYLNVTESQTPLEDVNMNCHQKKNRVNLDSSLLFPCFRVSANALKYKVRKQ